MGIRISILIGVFSLLYSLLIFHLYNLQLQKGSYYQAKADSIASWTDASNSTRGSIYFTTQSGDPVPVAITVNESVIYAVPKEVKNEAQAVSELQKVSGLSKASLAKSLGNKASLYAPIVPKATASEVAEIDSAKIAGLAVKEVPGRSYPLGQTASQLLGYTEASDPTQGEYGLELSDNQKLNAGQNVYLTIDSNIQAEAESLLTGLVTKYNATGGTIVVEDPKTGKILAMASNPSFDPNNYGAYPIGNFLNPAVQDVYEPGSVMKAVTMASGLDAGSVAPETTYNDTGKLVVDGQTIMDWDQKAHGITDMTTVIADSLNIGAAFVERQLGNPAFLSYLKKFGFNQKTDIGLPGEVVGSLAGLVGPNSRDVNYATASFGQGVSVTPVRMVEAISAIANHGVMMRPYLDASESSQEIGRVVSTQASEEAVKMMTIDVLHGAIAKISGYNVAGKSGSAQVPNLKTGGYTNQLIDSYVGFAPAYNPRFVILVKLNEPAGAPLSGVVVPTFHDLAQYILNYYNVPPDNVSQ